MQRSDLPLESPEALTDDEVDPRRGAYFPRRYLTEFFEFIAARKNDLEVLTYADLPWGDDWNYRAGYPSEQKAWEDQLASGERDPRKAYIVLQYDIDTRPERSMNLLKEPSHKLVPANIMIFNRRVDRRRLKNAGTLSYTDYDLDLDLLSDCEAEGHVVAYHTNAHERGVFDIEKALEAFDEDVKELSQRFDIRFFSAHGGVPGPDGKNNRDLPFHPDWQKTLRWVHNGHSPFFDAQFSDGGHNSALRDPESRDLRAFVAQMQPGKRYRILLHPQYYDLNPRKSPRFGGTHWYDEMLAAHERGEANLWSDVHLGSVAPPDKAPVLERLTWQSVIKRLRRWI